MVTVEDMLNMVEPGLYFAAWLHSGGKTVFEAVERDDVLMTFPSLSVKVFDVETRPIRGAKLLQDVLEHPRVKRLAETVGVPPSLGVYEYRFVPLKTVVVERSDSGAEFRKVVEEPVAPAIAMHVVHAYYSVYTSRSGRIYSETPGGAKAFMLVAERQIRRPQIYVHCHGRRCEVGVRIPIDKEQARQLIEFLAKP